MRETHARDSFVPSFLFNLAIGQTRSRATERLSQASSKPTAALREVVDSIAVITGSLLEIVGYNVEGQQYIYAVNYLRKIVKAKYLAEPSVFTVEKVKDAQRHHSTLSSPASELQKAEEGYIKLERGFAACYLKYPFHSIVGLVSCRSVLLSKKINPGSNTFEGPGPSTEQRQKLLYTILVELLAYQVGSRPRTASSPHTITSSNA
ncbi:hypothetical protein H0H92_000938 [Tricholoma furcatifolium]|nr:hypothetical protein H0H92_000938 [Tricholoma furcatifolium]